jgi:hypothetical protein
METTNVTDAVQDPRSSTPLQDEEITKSVVLASLSLEKTRFRSPLVDDSIHNKRGIIIQFVNSGCPETFPIIGGLKINLDDIRQVPLYLHQNTALIKQHGARVLMNHWKELNYEMG